MNDDLTKSGSVGVRWQAQMEQHLESVRLLGAEAVGEKVSHPGDRAMVRAQLATANATAALALAVANGLSDVDDSVRAISNAIREVS